MSEGGRQRPASAVLQFGEVLLEDDVSGFYLGWGSASGGSVAIRINV